MKMTEEENLRQKKLEELQEKARRQEEEQKTLETEGQISLMLRRTMTEEARQRLNNVKLVNRELYMKAVQAVISIVQQGYVREKITEEQVLQILDKLREKKDFTITRKQK